MVYLSLSRATVIFLARAGRAEKDRYTLHVDIPKRRPHRPSYRARPRYQLAISHVSHASNGARLLHWKNFAAVTCQICKHLNGLGGEGEGNKGRDGRLHAKIRRYCAKKKELSRPRVRQTDTAPFFSSDRSGYIGSYHSLCNRCCAYRCAPSPANWACGSPTSCTRWLRLGFAGLPHDHDEYHNAFVSMDDNKYRPDWSGRMKRGGRLEW